MGFRLYTIFVPQVCLSVKKPELAILKAAPAPALAEYRYIPSVYKGNGYEKVS